ncbi:hypothetical protein PIB30_073148 [Stylosanthes scabra]|uniref:Uncharacterized protein n=1 Tax=Stylosanthes scabra TaxID=79078 RepID=A0ABU6UQZ7_9FABA|nr:hypothetical protein [Stylosanthes scabra]
MGENSARVGWRIGPNQFSRRSRQLPIAITFDPELRLTHGLRLREALVALFPSIPHATYGLEWTNGVEDGEYMCLDARWRDGNRVYALSLASRWYPSRFTEPFWNGFEHFVTIESIRLWGESIRICSEAKTPQLKSIRLESTPHSKFHEPPKIESIRRITEPIRLHPTFKFNVQNALRIDSSSSESILKRKNMISKGFQRANDSAYGNSGPSGVVSAVGSLFPRGRKTNVAAHGSYRGAFGSGPGYQIRY